MENSLRIYDTITNNIKHTQNKQNIIKYNTIIYKIIENELFEVKMSI